MGSAISFAAMLISVAMMGAFLLYAFYYKKELGVRYFIGVMACRIVYAVGVILELNSWSFEEKLFFSKCRADGTYLYSTFHGTVRA